MTDRPEFVSLPPARLTLSQKPEDAFPMRVTDWDRLHKKVAKLKKMRRDYTSAGWAFLGFAASSIPATIAWVPAYAALPALDKVTFAWITPAFVIAGVCTAVFGGALLVFAHVTARSQRDYADELSEEMTEIRPRTKTA